MEHLTMKSAQQDHEWVISSGERLTIETINEYVQLIRTGLAEAETVILEFDPQVEMDITALQALCSACKTAVAWGKQCLHRGPRPKALIELAAAIGAERPTPCGSHNDSCFRQLGGADTCQK